MCKSRKTIFETNWRKLSSSGRSILQDTGCKTNIKSNVWNGGWEKTGIYKGGICSFK